MLRQFLFAFVPGWALLMALSALARVLVGASFLEMGPGDITVAVWQTLNAVPPLAKLALGVILLIFLAGASMMRDRPLLPALAAIAALLVTLNLPFIAYYPEVPSGISITAQIIAALLAGLYMAFPMRR
ncbi:MAG: hypothetical protein AAGD92_08410 [Pseudomonadota bacterium]